MKKIIVLCVFILMVFSVICFAETPVFYEQNENSSIESSQVVCMNADMRGTLTYDNDYDIDYYRIIIPFSGEVSISFSHDYIDTSSTVCSLAVYWHQSDARIWSADISGNSADSSFYSFYLGEGEYDFVISNKNRSVIDYSYTFSYKAEQYAELEGNNVPENATSILPNVAYHGSLSYDDDVDYYRLSLEQAGEVSLSFSHEYFDKGDTYYRISITKGIGGPVMRGRDINGRTSDDTTYDFYLDADDYYIRIEDYYHTNRPYTFQVNYVENDLTEKENNNAFDSATEIPVNTEIKGAFAVDDDVDTYHFVLDAPGEVVLHHRHEYFDKGDTYYIISLYSNKQSDALLFSDKLTGRSSDWTRYAVYLPAGDYYLQYKDYYWTTTPYSFTIDYTPMETIEIEWNDSYKNATALDLNTAYTGSLMSDDDKDYYTFTLDELSEIVIQFQFEYFDKGDTYFKLFLDTESQNNTCYYSTNLSGRDNDISTYPFYLPAGTYYFHVESYYHTTRPYNLTINANSCTDAEEEWNNSYATATQISVGQNMKGAIRYKEDVDYYVLNITETQTVSIRLQHEWFDKGDIYYQAFLDAEANNSNRLLTMKASGRDADVVSDAITLNPGVYYLSVGSYYQTGIPYILSVE